MRINDLLRRSGEDYNIIVRVDMGINDFYLCSPAMINEFMRCNAPALDYYVKTWYISGENEITIHAERNI